MIDHDDMTHEQQMAAIQSGLEASEAFAVTWILDSNDGDGILRFIDLMAEPVEDRGEQIVRCFARLGFSHALLLANKERMRRNQSLP